jgi:hypothetical protein
LNANTKSQASSVSGGEVYLALVDLVTNAESVTWNRFYTFLTASSILILAWTTVFVSQIDQIIIRNLVLGSICILGAIISLAWAALGVRGRGFLFDFGRLGKEMEAVEEIWPIPLQNAKPLTRAAEIRDTATFRWAGSFYLLVFVPLLFALLYAVFLAVSIPLNMAGPFLAAIFIVWIWIAVTWRREIRRRKPRICENSTA